MPSSGESSYLYCVETSNIYFALESCLTEGKVLAGIEKGPSTSSYICAMAALPGSRKAQNVLLLP